jgi:hypothetical protein
MAHSIDDVRLLKDVLHLFVHLYLHSDFSGKKVRETWCSAAGAVKNLRLVNSLYKLCFFTLCVCALTGNNATDRRESCFHHSLFGVGRHVPRFFFAWIMSVTSSESTLSYKLIVAVHVLRCGDDRGWCDIRLHLVL